MEGGIEESSGSHSANSSSSFKLYRINIIIMITFANKVIKLQCNASNYIRSTFIINIVSYVIIMIIFVIKVIKLLRIISWSTSKLSKKKPSSWIIAFMNINIIIIFFVINIQRRRGEAGQRWLGDICRSLNWQKINTHSHYVLVCINNASYRSLPLFVHLIYVIGWFLWGTWTTNLPFRIWIWI